MLSHPNTPGRAEDESDRVISRYWSNDEGPAPVHITGDALRAIYSARKSGLLFLRAQGWTDCDIHFRDGKVVGCAGPADEWRLGRLLISTGTLTPEDLEGVVANLHTTWLADAVVDRGLLTTSALEGLVGDLIRDSFVFACGAPWRNIWFEEHPGRRSSHRGGPLRRPPGRRRARGAALPGRAGPLLDAARARPPGPHSNGRGAGEAGCHGRGERAPRLIPTTSGYWSPSYAQVVS